MYDFNNYDSDIAYSYDDYIEDKDDSIDAAEYNFERYQEQMIENLIDEIRKDV